jgi:hypothetical protein
MCWGSHRVTPLGDGTLEGVGGESRPCAVAVILNYFKYAT